MSAVLNGLKVSTTSLQLEYELEGSPLPVPGKRSVVVDSMNRPVALIETTSVEIARLGDVDLAHAVDEGEGFESVADWRAGHEEFWHCDDMRRELNDPAFTVNNTTKVVLERFRVIERISDASLPSAP
ncbi:MAG TPA: ASCH domain-containing protein [Acidimicrobiales bacterium]|nr:ASCH domain-containing protein [Acidimicrobiales bacterium]